MSTSLNNWFRSFINEQNIMTCLIVWLFQSHRQKIDFTSRILRRWRKFAKSIFSMRFWIVKKLSIFFNWSCNLTRFLSTKSIWVEIETSTKNAYSVHFFFQRFMWKRFIFLLLTIEANRIVIESHWVRSECQTNYYQGCLLVDQLLCDSLMLQLARSEFMHSRSFRIVAQLVRCWFAFFTNDVRHVCDFHAIFDLNLQLIQMQIDENDVRLNFQNRDQNDSKRFENAS
jgi:hypothetical protein